MFEGKSTISITIFNSYVKLPEGNGETKKNDWNAGFTKKKWALKVILSVIWGMMNGFNHGDLANKNKDFSRIWKVEMVILNVEVTKKPTFYGTLQVGDSWGITMVHSMVHSQTWSLWTTRGIYGIYMEITWNIYGIYMEYIYIWNICGMYGFALWQWLLQFAIEQIAIEK